MAEVTELRVWAGGQIDADSHGDATVGVRRGPWRAELLTDTVDLAWEPQQAHGRAWVEARANGMSAEMFISPWTSGAPDPARATLAAYGGLEAGVLRYGPSGTYAGVAGSVRLYAFDPYGGDARALGLGGADLVAGVWRPAYAATLRGGVQAQQAADRTLPALAADEARTVQPHVLIDAHWHPDRAVAPVIDGWAGLADGQGALTRTRVGGLTPYGVPLPGAAWAEWWVEDYAAVRGGVAAGATGLSTPARGLRARGTATAEVATFSAPYGDPGAPRTAVGFSAGGTLTARRFYTTAEVGWAPWIPRAEGLTAVSVFFRVGVDWAPLGATAPPS